MKKLGIVGWRGMVGSTLMKRMKQENDFSRFQCTLFSTSQAGQDVPKGFQVEPVLADAYDLNNLKTMDIIITCQGSEYTQKIFEQLRQQGWNGYWIDAASQLRMDERAFIILDPLNQKGLKEYIANGGNNLIGGNCTVSLMLMALGGLFEADAVEWVSSMTYQASSGAGAKNMQELLDQQQFISNLSYDSSDILDREEQINQILSSSDFPTQHFGHPLALNLLPYIDSQVEQGQSREEWKAMVEAQKIIGLDHAIPIDGTCVRVPNLRCHSQAFTIKLKKDLDLAVIEDLISTHNQWVKVIANDKESTLSQLTPHCVSGSLNIHIGRLRKMKMGAEYLNAFSVGDQLLWGAAEPLRRALSYVN